MIRFACLTLLAAAGLAGPGSAQTLVLTKDDGRPLVVGDGGLQADLTAPLTDVAASVAMFRQVCLPDPAGAAARIDAAPAGLTRADVVLPPEGNQAEVRVPHYLGAGMSLTVWTGDETGLKGRAIAIPSRGSTTTGPYGPFRATGAQCNMVLLLPNFAAMAQVSDALTAALGSPAKLVAKSSFADGHWLAGTTRINFTAPTVRAGPQPVHLSAQAINEGKTR